MVKQADVDYVRKVVVGESECSIRELFELLGEGVAGDSELLEVYGDASVRSAVEIHKARTDTFDSIFVHGVIDLLAHGVAEEVGDSFAEGMLMWCANGESANRVELVRALRPLLRHLVGVVY